MSNANSLDEELTKALAGVDEYEKQVQAVKLATPAPKIGSRQEEDTLRSERPPPSGGGLKVFAHRARSHASDRDRVAHEMGVYPRTSPP